MDLWTWISLLFSFMFYLHLTSLYSLAGARTLADVITTTSNDVTTPFASQDTREHLQNTSKTIENKDEAHLQVLGKETASKDEKLPHGAQANNSSNSSNENGANTSTQNDVIDVTSSLTFTSDSSPEMTHRFPPKSVENGECLEKVALLLPIALEQIAQVAVGLHTSSIRNRLINMV